MAQSPLRLIPASELSSLPPTERLGLTKFVARGLNVIYGHSGSYKSFYALDASLRIAQSRAVVYVAAEGVSGLHNRVAAWCEYNHTGPGQAYFVPQEVNLLDESSVTRLGQIAADIKPTMVVFDTLARCIPGGDENSARDMGLAVRSAGILQRGLKAAVSWLHHTDKSQRYERGSGAIRGASDSMIEMMVTGDGLIKVSCSKSKDGEPWVTESLRFEPVGKSGVLVPAMGYQTTKFTAEELSVLELLALEVFEPDGTPGAKAGQIMNSLNIPERKVYHILSHLKRELQIIQCSKGDPYTLTELGRQTVTASHCKNPEISEVDDVQ